MPVKLPGFEDLSAPVSGRSGRPIASYDTSAIGQGVAQFGRGLSSASNSLRVAETKTKAEVDKTQVFDTERRYLEFKASRERALSELGQKEQPGAFGFKERYQEDYLKNARQFMSSVPDELKPVYDVKLYQSEDELAGRALNFEREQRKGYYKTNVEDGLTKIESRLYANPKEFDGALFEGESFIDSLPDEDVGPIEKDALRRAWKAKAQFASLNGMKPAERLRALGEAPGEGDIINAMASVESAGDDRAVSGAGAIGRMQVMPDTAAEIAQEIGDPNFPANPDAQTEYLKNPDVSTKYGTYYYQKMLARYDGDQEAALVAYNGGPERADRWLASGRDDSVIPTESADYYKKVLDKVKGEPAKATGPEQPLIVGDAQAKAQGRISAPDVRGVQPLVIDRFKQVQNAFGASIPIVSGFRDPDRNRKAGGAKSSQHMHGNAIDLDVSKLSEEDRLRLIQTASAQGFTGIGVYANSIHLDIGARRAWGPDHHSGSVPGWARGAIDQHLAGSAKPLGTTGRAGFQIDPRFADMGYVERDKIVSQTQAEVKQQVADQRVRATADYKAYDDAVALNIGLGRITSEAEIIDDPRLNDADRLKNLNALRAKKKQDGDIQEAMQQFAAGALRVDPFSEDGRKTVDGVYASAVAAVSPEQAQALTEEVVRQTGIVPKSAMSAVRIGIQSSNPDDVAAALQSAQRLSTVDPAALGRRDGGGEIQKAVDDFSYRVNTLNMSPDAAAAKAIEDRNPEKQRQRKAIEPAAKEFIKQMGEVDLAGEFNSAWLSSDPALGFTPTQEIGIKADFLAIAEDQFYQANGDPELAKNRAVEEMKRLYGVTEFGGAKAVVKHPPERYWPKSWYKSDQASLTGTVEPSLGYAREQLRADVNAFARGAAAPEGDIPGLSERGNIDLAKRPAVENPDGTISTVRSMSFEEDGKEVLIPTVSPDGAILSDEQAMDLYRKSGQHLGKFETVEAANGYAASLHDRQAKFYGVKEIDPSTIQLVTTPETDAQIKRGELPGYAVLYKDSNGVYQTIPGKLWRPDTIRAAELQKTSENAEKDRSVAGARLQQKQERDQLPYRQRGTVDFLSGNDPTFGGRDNEIAPPMRRLPKADDPAKPPDNSQVSDEVLSIGSPL